MEWIDGVKLTTLPPEEIRALVKVGNKGPEWLFDCFVVKAITCSSCI